MTIIWLVGLALTFFKVHRSRQKRKSALTATTQLNAATDMLSVLLLSGMTTPQALHQLHHYLDEPSRTVFHDCSTQTTNGIAMRTGSCLAAASSSCRRCCRVTALRRSSKGPTAIPSRSLASSASHSANAGLPNVEESCRTTSWNREP